MDFQQSNFTGGLNLLDSDTELKDNEYRLLINATPRYGDPIPVAKSQLLNGPRNGVNYQGVVAVGNTLIAFLDGRAYYRVHNSETWIRISDFLMDETARKFWTCLVPKSTYDYVRKRNDTLNNPLILNTDFTISGNPAGLVIQDGINQPWLIEFNAISQTFVARACKTYADWANTSVTANDREYVPVGKQMFILNQKLFIVAPDGKSLYHSVTGRPLDFMVNVDNNGNKLPSEAFGGATSVSFAFDSDEITCVKPTNITDTFVYATNRFVRLLTLDYANTILGEPTYRQAQIIEAGVVGDEAFGDNLGDFVFIDGDGIKSFNAVVNYRVEGRNSVFSAQIALALRNRVQKATQAAIANHDNFVYFYCLTGYGYAICVFDTLRQKWVSINITEVVNIKQFAVFRNGTVDELYAVTNDGIYHMYSSDTREMAQMHLKTLAPDDYKKEHKGSYIKPLFRGATLDGSLQVIEYADEQLSAVQTRDIVESVMAMEWPLRFPIGFNSKPNAINNTINFDRGLVGKNLAYVILWNTDAALQAVKVVTSECDPRAATRQTATS